MLPFPRPLRDPSYHPPLSAGAGLFPREEDLMFASVVDVVSTVIFAAGLGGLVGAPIALIAAHQARLDGASSRKAAEGTEQEDEQ